MIGNFNNDPDKLPTKPVISSLTAAISEIETWTASHKYEEVKDMDGLVWKLEVSQTQEPNKKTVSGLIWKIRLQYKAEASIEELLETGTLDEDKDRRLVEIISNNIIPLAVRPVIINADDEEAALSEVSVLIPKMMKSLSSSPLFEIKRKLIGKWVDNHSLFGSFDS